MKKCYLRMAMLLAFAAAATACKDETPGYNIEPDGPSTPATGYLRLATSGFSVVVDAETDQNTESSTSSIGSRAGEIGEQTGAPLGSEVTVPATGVVPDEFRVKIVPANGGTPLFEGSYGELKAQMTAADGKGIEAPVGIYELRATSNTSADGKPSGVQATPSYAGSVQGIQVMKDNVTNVEQVVCTLQNIKITIEVAADLYENLDYLDGNQRIDASVFYGSDLASSTIKWTVPANWDWTSKEIRPVYFPAMSEKGTTLHLSFRAKLQGSAEAITMNKDIPNILAGQWRKIKIIPKYDTTGNITFDVEVSTFVQDDTIIVGDSSDATYTMEWQELPYEDVEDSATTAPSMTWGDGTSLPETIEVGSTAITQPVRFSVPNGIAQFVLDFTTTNPDFSAEAASLTALDLCTVSRNTYLTNFGIPFGAQLTGSTEVEFTLDKIVSEIRDFAGSYTFIFTVTDQQGKSAEQIIRFNNSNGSSGGNSGSYTGPTAVWSNGTLYDEDGYDASGSPKPGLPFVELNESMQIALQLHAEPHFEKISVKITSQVLNAELLGFAGLPTEFDLCDLKDFEFDGDPITAADQANTLINNLELIDKVGEELKKESTVIFNITRFVEVLVGLGSEEKFQFALTVTDSEGHSITKYLRLQNPAE